VADDESGISRFGGRQGVGVALLAAVLFGLSAPIAKLLLGRTTPQLLAGLLYLGSGLGLLAVWLVHRRGSHEAPLTRRDAPWLAGAIAFGGVVGPLLLMIGLTRTAASAASLLLNLEGVFTALLAWFVFRENFDWRIALGMLAILAGGVVLSWEGELRVGGVLGSLAIAGACLAWAVDNNLTQKVSGGDPVQVAMLKGLVAGTVNTAIAIALGATWPRGGTVSAAMVLGFLSYGASLTLFVLALRHLGTARTGAYFSVAPFVGAAASLVIFRERPTALFLTGAALMALGVWFHLTERHDHVHYHEAMEHEHAHVHDEHHRHAHDSNDPAVTDPTPHSHVHRHEPIAHTHPHYPDLHHRHSHDAADASEHAEERAGPGTRAG
jgi:drug/metabolite transporter (DMT)-like permease